MNRILRALALVAVAALLSPRADAEEKKRTGPLADLPSKPGPHLAKLEALGDDEWLDLGSPARDPKWGKARGRSWSAPMPHAPDFGGAFLYGEGVHGYTKPDGHYMDDLWFYDANAHRWVCVHPGYDTKNPPELVVNADGFESVKGGEPVPIAAAVHEYGMATYDPDAGKFACVLCGGDYWGKAMPKRVAFLKENGKKLNATHASPWFYDVAGGKWERRKTTNPGPATGYGGLLVYLPTKKQFWNFGKGTASLYDPAANQWTASVSKDRQPTGIDFGHCYDGKRGRVYVCGGSYRGPYAKDEGKVYVYDVKTDSWSNPPDKGDVPPVFATNYACVHYDTANDRVVCIVFAAKKTGVFVLDPSNDNTWAEKPLPLPAKKGPNLSRCWNGFYSPKLNVHFFHVASDSGDDGTVWAYRYKKTTQKK